MAGYVMKMSILSQPGLRKGPGVDTPTNEDIYLICRRVLFERPGYDLKIKGDK